MLHNFSKFGIIAHARTGSSALLRTLGLHPRIDGKILWEPFGWRNKPPAGTEPIGHITKLMKNRCGFKHLFGQVTEQTNYKICAMNGYKFVTLRRRNLLESEVSFQLAVATNHWNRLRKSTYFEDLKKCEVTIDIKDLAKQIKKKKRQHQLMQELDAHQIFYEDLYFGDKEGQLKKMLKYLGYSPVVTDEMLEILDNKHKLNNNETYKLIKNIDEIEHVFGPLITS